MSNIPFSESEMTILREIPSSWEGEAPTRIYARPVSSKENWRRIYQKQTPVWCPHDLESVYLAPTVVPDNVARGLVLSKEAFDPDTQAGGPDMYGTMWVYQPQQGGSMVVPGAPRIDDMNDWEKIVTRPDVDSWDWEGSARANAGYLSQDSFNVFMILSGWFERLISLMDFAEAALALIDEDQKQAVHEFFAATTEDICKIIDNAAKHYPGIDCFCIHDDWGGQAMPFFSQETAMEMIVPYMKKVTDHIHAKGMFAELHSCGHTEERVEAYIAAGWDSWCPQPMNNTPALYEKYGDRMIFTITPDIPENASAEQQKQVARDFVRRYCKPGKLAIPGGLTFTLTQAFEEELYRQSRMKLLED